MTPDEIGITVTEQGRVRVTAPEGLRALAALLESDLRVEGPSLYKVLARLHLRDDSRWEVTGNACALMVDDGRAEIVNNFTDDRTTLSKDDLLVVLERLRDELAFARARRR